MIFDHTRKENEGCFIGTRNSRALRQVGYSKASPATLSVKFLDFSPSLRGFGAVTVLRCSAAFGCADF